MKIALTTLSPEPEAEIDLRFGRGAYFLILDTDTQMWQAQENPGASASGGAGIRAAQFLSGQKVGAAISGDFGPHAYSALKKAGIPMYVYGACQTAQEAIDAFQAGSLKTIDSPTREECHPETEENS
jgi:predicted Fe-Mo cluster-binding NifX family protein